MTTMTYMLILMLGAQSYNTAAVTAVTVPMLNEAACLAAYEKAKAHWGERLKGAQCLSTGAQK